MSSSALATAFGPLFTAHSESDSLRKPIEVFKFLIEIWPIRRDSTSRSNSEDSMLNNNKQPGQGLPGLPATSTETNNIVNNKMSISGANVATSSCLPPSSSSSSASTVIPVIGSSLTYVTSSRDSYQSSPQQQQSSSSATTTHRHRHHSSHHSQSSQQSQHHHHRESHHQSHRSSSNDDALGIPSLTPGPSPTQLNERLTPDSPPQSNRNLTSSSGHPTSSSGPINSQQHYSDSYSSTNPFRTDYHSSTIKELESTTADLISSRPITTTTASGITRSGGGLISTTGITGINSSVNSSSTNADRSSTIKKSVAWAAGTRNNEDPNDPNHLTSNLGNNNLDSSDNLNNNNTQGIHYSSSLFTKESNVGDTVNPTSSSSSTSRDRYSSSLSDNNNNLNRKPYSSS